VGRIDAQLTREGAAQDLVGGNESSQTLVDLTVLPLASPLNGLHQQQANSHGNYGYDDQP
jgi:hypothetical protein